MAILAEGLGDHHGRKESGCQQGDDRVGARRQFFAPTKIGPMALIAALARATPTIATQSAVMRSSPSVREALQRKRRSLAPPEGQTGPGRARAPPRSAPRRSFAHQRVVPP